MSTDSGIPDYRGPDSPPSNPMTIRQFTSDPAFRQRYWARNHVGWRHMDDTLPNAGHRALADAGARRRGVGRDHPERRPAAHQGGQPRRWSTCTAPTPQVVCLDCGHTMTRAALAEQLEALNPGFVERAEAVGGIAVAPDADAMVGDTASFRYVDCPRCGGMLKPDIVYFGESVPKDRVDAGVFACRRGRRAAGRRVVADGVLRATGSSGTPPRRASRSRSSTAAAPAATSWRPSRSTAAAPRCWRCWPTNCRPQRPGETATTPRQRRAHSARGRESLRRCRLRRPGGGVRADDRRGRGRRDGQRPGHRRPGRRVRRRWPRRRSRGSRRTSTQDDWGDPNAYPLDASGTGVTFLLPQALIDAGRQRRSASSGSTSPRRPR